MGFIAFLEAPQPWTKYHWISVNGLCWDVIGAGEEQEVAFIKTTIRGDGSRQIRRCSMQAHNTVEVNSDSG